MICDPQKIYLYLERELDQSARAQVELHLQQCAECAGNLEGQQTILNQLDDLQDLNTTLELEHDILQHAYQDLTATFDHQDERRRARLAAWGLTALTVGGLSLDALTASVFGFLLGLRVAGRIIWDLTTIFLEAASSVVAVLFRHLAGNASAAPLFPLLLAIMLSLALVRLVTQLDIRADK